jgi:hypothetical protein
MTAKPASVAIDPKHWRKRAEEARDLADKMSDPLAKELMLGIAKDYELLAARNDAGTSDSKEIDERDHQTRPFPGPLYAHLVRGRA